MHEAGREQVKCERRHKRGLISRHFVTSKVQAGHPETLGPTDSLQRAHTYTG